MKFLNTLLSILIIGLWALPVPVQAADPLAELLFPWLKPPIDVGVVYPSDGALYVDGNKYVAGEEVIDKRTESSKTTYLGKVGKNDKLVTSFYKEIKHYKDNYNNANEEWKDIDLTFVNGKIDKAPFIIEIVNGGVIITSKKTGSVSFMGLNSIGSSPTALDKSLFTYNKGKAVQKGVVKDTDVVMEVVEEGGAIKFRYGVVYNTADAVSAQRFTVSKTVGSVDDISVISDGRDANGFKIPVSKVELNGVITETLVGVSAVEGKLCTEEVVSGKTTISPVKFPIQVDPTVNWTSTGTVNWTVPAAVYSVEYVVVGGGGTGVAGGAGGGGGAGGFRNGTMVVTPSTNITIVVGGSGVASSLSNTTLTITSAAGGDSGIFASPPGTSGGSGGGGMGFAVGVGPGAGGAGNSPSTSPSQGNNGGSGGGGGDWAQGGGGGGGGAGGVGSAGGYCSAMVLRYGAPGNGGSGIYNNITGTSVKYAGGGAGYGGDCAGSSYYGTSGGGTYGVGGTGGAGTQGIVIISYVQSPSMISTIVASSVEETTATVGGNVTVMGSGNITSYGTQYGTSGSYGSWCNTTATKTAVFSYYDYLGTNTTALSQGTLYYYRAWANDNVAGYSYGSQSTFLTKPLSPSLFTCTANDTGVDLSWTKATVGANTTLYTTVRYSAAGYPASITDGTASYNGTATSWVQMGLVNGTPYYFRAWSTIWDGSLSQVSDTYESCWAVPAAMPKVSTLSSSLVTDLTASATGNITDLQGGANCTIRGIAYDVDSGFPYTYTEFTNGSYGVGSYTIPLSAGILAGSTIYFRAYATNPIGTGWGDQMSFLTKPAAPTGVSATDGASSTEVTITWTKSTGATDYHVWRDAVDLGAAGDVDVFHDTGAAAPTITAGSAVASDGDYTSYVKLDITGESVSNGTTHTYKVVASNATGDSADSLTDTGYRGTTTLTYAWQRTATDAVGGVYSATGNTTDPAYDTGAPSDGSGRWYRAVIGMSGATSANTTNNRGYRAGPPTVATTGVTGIGDTWAVGGGSLTSGLLLATQVGVDYGLTSSYGDSYVTVGSYATGAFSVYVSGLSVGVTYHYRAKALVEGLWYYGLDSVFSTLGAATPFVSWGLGGDSDSSKINSANITYQTFTTNTTAIPYSVTKINLMVKRVGLPGIVTASIRATTLPATTTMVGATITSSNSTGFAWGATSNSTLPLLETPPASYLTNYTVASTNLAAGTFTYNNPLAPSSLYYYRGYSNNVTGWFWSGETALYGTPAYPVGTDIASGTLDGATFGLGYSWYTFTMTTEVCLNPNTVYAIVLRCEDADSSNYVLWQAQAAGAYPGGNSGYSVDSGVTWIHALPADQLFEVWGNPCFTISDAKVFSTYMSTGDWLITCLYKNLYPPYYAQARDVSSLFVLQLYNPSTATVIAQTKCFEWGYKPGAIYLAPSQTTYLQWGYPYRVRLYGLFTGNPYTEYVLQPTDYLGSDLTRLDSWVRSCASLMETYYNTALTTYLTDRGVVLNSAGGVIFATDIPQLSVRRPNLFSIVSATATPTTGEYSQPYQDTLRWEVLMGPQLARTFTAVGNTVGVSGATIGSWLGFLIYALVALFCFRPGHAIAAMVVPVPILLIAFGTGLAELALMGILIAVAIVLGVWQIWWKGA